MPTHLYKALIIFWSLTPWAFLTLGLHWFENIPGTFFLYHFCCLAPAIAINRKAWQSHLIAPTRGELLTILVAGAGLATLTYFVYSAYGHILIDKETALTSLHERGYQPGWFLPMSAYFLIVNPVIEELFWRGVVLNELEGENFRLFALSSVWTNCAFAAWHFLVVRLFVRPTFVPLAVLIVVAVGFYLSWLYRKTGSVLVPALWHSLVFDLAVVVMLYLVVHT